MITTGEQKAERADAAEQRREKPAHTLVMEGRERAMLEGVIAVSCLNEQEIVLETREGEVAIFGRALHMEQLSLDDGRLHVTGEITGVEYTPPKPSRGRRGLFARRGKAT